MLARRGATAPLSEDGHVNCSPKGGDSFRVLGPREVVYQDYTGSGIETAAHLRENGRIVVMFCAFDGKPNIVRLHGRGTVLTPDDARYDDLLSRASSHLGLPDVLYLIAAGPTACLLAWDLAQRGAQALDVGHLTSAYDEFAQKK